MNIEGIYSFAELLLLNVVYIKMAGRFTWSEMLIGFKTEKND